MNIFKRPMLYAALTCSVAAVISIHEKLLAFIIMAMVLSVFIIFICHKKFKYITVAITILLFSVSLYSQFSEMKKMNELDDCVINGKFLVTSEPVLYDEFTLLTLSTKKCEKIENGTKILVFDYKKTSLDMGNVVYADITVKSVGAFDEYRLSNYGDDIYATGYTKKIVYTSDNDVFYHSVGKIRGYVKKIMSSFAGGNTSGLLLALTTGDKTLINDSFSNNIKTTGISHVVVVSGMHLSIIMSAVFWCLDRLFYNKYIKSILSIAFVFLIFGICGFTMSITRAGAMFIIAGLASVFGRDNDSLSSLLTAITLVLIAAPFAVFNISFLLSAFSTLAIIWVVPFYYRIITNRFNISSKFIKAIINVTLCSIFAVIFTLPITIITFGFMSIVSPITNLLITYPITIVLVLNILSLTLFAIPIIEYIAYPLLCFVKLCGDVIVYIVNSIAEIPITVAVLPKDSFWWSIGLIVLIIGYMYYYDFKQKRSDLNANCI